jgi:biopolymer transport protein ExbB/TolQ
MAQSHHVGSAVRSPRQQLALQLVLSPWLWGALLTGLLYAAIPHLPVGREFAERYFTAHPTEYALVALSLLGLSILCIKGITNRWEWQTFRQQADFGITDPQAPLEARLQQLEHTLARVRLPGHSTYWSQRLAGLLSYLKHAGKSRQDHEQLTYLSEASADRLHAGYGLMNTIIWAIPIIGFLGTVLGITLAIANLTPDQLETALNDVTRDLALAFDTTAIALTSSLLLGFLSLFIKRSEERLLREIDAQTRLELQRCFPAEAADSPWLQAQQNAAAVLVDSTEELLREQTAHWRESLEQARSRWQQVVEQQQGDLAASLNSATHQTVQSHAELLASFREEFLNGYQAVAAQLQRELQELDTRQQETSTVLRLTLGQFSQQLQEQQAQSLQQQSAQLDGFAAVLGQHLDRFQQSLGNWEQRLAQVSQFQQEHAAQLRAQTEALQSLIGQEAELIRLEGRLTDNLEAVRAAESFDNTLHNLSAAVHLLTARARAA